MNNQGFYITSLRVLGSGKADAIVTFNQGLNVISGPSDTGKSYIYECINFMLGSSKRPEELEKEDIGYDKVILTIKDYNDIDYTLQREFKSRSFTVWKLPYNKILTATDYKIYNLTNTKNPENTISYFYMNLLKGYGLKIKKNQRGSTINLTFGTIRPFFQVNETKIQERASFLLQDKRSITSQERSAFRSFLTKLDDKDCKEIESKDIQEAKVNGKIEYLEEIKDKLSSRIDQKKEKLKDFEKKSIIDKIDNITNVISIESKSMKEATTLRKDIWDNITSLESKLIYNQELVERFKLLIETYLDDLERLEFIEEGSHYISQLENTECPTCNQVIEDDSIDLKEQKAGIEFEKNSISMKSDDLSNTINKLVVENSELQTEIESFRKQLKLIDVKINTELKSIIDLSKEELHTMQNMINDFNVLESDKLELAEVIARINYYSDLKITGNQKTEYTNELGDKIISKICTEIYEVLKSWHYIDLGEVTYDDEKDDFRINRKSRLSHGKGHRAILYSAYLTGLLKYSQKSDSNTLHPHLVIMDSPLTAYKKEEQYNIPEEDMISYDTEIEFFKNLSKLKDSQIIIVDNKEPKGIANKDLNHIHFTKNKNHGRYGFFPI